MLIEKTELRLTGRPKITMPTVVLHGDGNGVATVRSSKEHARLFTGRHEGRVLPSIGYNVPQEAAEDFAAAVLSLM